MRGLAKWRRKTVDFADDMFMDVAVAFGAPDTRPKTEKKKKEEEQKKKVFRIYVWPFNFRRIIQICITETIFLIIKLNLSLYIHEISKARSYLEQAEKFL